MKVVENLFLKRIYDKKNSFIELTYAICSLNSAFNIRFLVSSIRNLDTGEISIFLLVSVAGETGLK